MQKLFYISYDLDKPGQNYQPLLNRLRELGAINILLSDWQLKHTASAVDIRNDLQRFMDGNDRIFVAVLTGEAAWYNVLTSVEAVKKTFAA